MENRNDQLYRFLFEKANIRGEIVRLNDSYLKMLQHHQYPAPVRQLLGELAAATILLSATLKFEGKLTLQIQGMGPLELLVVQSDHRQQIRAMARHRDNIQQQDWRQLIGNGQMAITIEPEQGQRYQGIVPLEGQNIAECIEGYFRYSEQLETKLCLAADENSASGVLLQSMPESDQRSDMQQNFEHLSVLLSSLKPDELLQINSLDILHRLFHAESDIVIYHPQPVQFHCSCSRERTGQALKTVPLQELLEILKQHNPLEMHCEFCNQCYTFDEIDVQTIHNGGHLDPKQNTLN